MALRLTEKPSEPARRLFGTDGIRGVANVHPMTGEMMLQLGRALAYLIKQGPHRHRVVIGKDKLHHLRPTATSIGKAFRIEDAGGRYVVYAKNTFPKDLTLEGLTVVIDCGHGAAYRVAPAVLQELGAKVITIGAEPDGKNINKGFGALHPETMCKAVLKTGANIGLALDGDADRLIVADEKGRVVNGDAVMAVCGLDLLRRKALPKKTLVATVMSTLGLDQCVAKAGGRVVRPRVGDRYVVEEMRKSGYSFGGEQSGHLIFLEHATTGDATVAALRLLSVMQQSGKPISELAQVMEVYPQAQLNLPVRSKPELGSLPAVMRAIRDVEEKLGKEGRVLVRYSGTEPKVRVLVEGPDKKLIETYADGIAAELKKSIGA